MEALNPFGGYLLQVTEKGAPEVDVTKLKRAARLAANSTGNDSTVYRRPSKRIGQSKVYFG